jgi:CRISPR/Cas system endoribonuclease Cas6 (RAMP superfamily)
MKMGGLVGELRLRGPGLATFWPALWHGQWVHLGKGTSFGLGAYRLEAVGARGSMGPGAGLAVCRP